MTSRVDHGFPQISPHRQLHDGRSVDGVGYLARGFHRSDGGGHGVRQHHGSCPTADPRHPDPQPRDQEAVSLPVDERQHRHQRPDHGQDQPPGRQSVRSGQARLGRRPDLSRK